jgi:holo-[acyl-carrier protein] synthase
MKHGVDVIEIERVKSAINRHGERFLRRIYTQVELAECGEKVSSLAVRFAGKEAVAKALGTGIGEISWCEIEIHRVESGAPKLNLYGRAAREADLQGLKIWAISLSHTRTLAFASVVASE